MAKKEQDGAVNKSAAIRDILQENFKTPVKEIIERLAQQGLQVHRTMVYLIKSKMKQQKKKEARQQRVSNKQGRKLGVTELVLKVKTLAEETGGIGNLKKLVDALMD
jgi:flagellar hook-length control protein FliK